MPTDQRGIEGTLRRGWVASLGGVVAFCLVMIAGGPAATQDAQSRMALGVVTHFGQGWDIDLQEEAAALNAKVLRDGINWTLVEATPGRYDFSDRRTGFPAAIDSRFATIINFSYPNPHYDQGFTPHTDAGRQAQAAFVVATLDRFPDIDIIEIGNEFNAGNFVTGPVRTDSYAERSAYYFELLRAVYLAVKQQHPDVQVLGGATHSIPVAYLTELFALGALDYMDGIAVHPYTSLPEHLGDHLAVLRAAMGGDAVPIHVTEFSQEVSTPAEAAPYLVKMVTVMAASGVATAAWYALLEQPYYRNMGLLETDRASRPASRAFSFIQSILDSFGNPQDVSPDDRLSRVYRYGDRVLVAWGIPREIRLGTGVTAYDAEGRTIGGRPLYLDENDPVILVADRPIALGQDVAFGDADVVGDSLFQFDVVNDGTDARGGAWSYYALNGEGRRDTLHTRGGGAVSDEAWRPYIGHDWLRPLAVEPTSVTPVDFADGQVPKDQYSVVERFTAAEAGIVAIEGSWRVSEESEDGIVLTIVVDGAEIYSQTTAGELVVAIPAVRVEAGSTIEFIVGVNGNARGGDRTVRRIRILRAS